jgi:thioredoxin 1
MVDDPVQDDDLRRIREKKLREMTREMGMRAKGRVQEVTDATFSTVIRESPRALVDFWAEWCGPCRMVAPVVENLAVEFAGSVDFGKCNTDDNPMVARTYQISAIPTLLLFSHGQVVDRIIGAYPAESIRARILRAFF